MKMKHMVPVVLVVLIAIGYCCMQRGKKPEVTPTRTAPVVAQEKAKLAVAPAAIVTTEAPRKEKPAVPSAAAVVESGRVPEASQTTVRPTTAPVQLSENAAPSPSAPTNRVPTNEMPMSLAFFLRVPSATILKPEAEARKVIEKAQDLFRQGLTNAAVDLLGKAVDSPAYAEDRTVLSRKLIALLLYSGRVADAQAAYVASATDEKTAAINLSIIHDYLMFERKDAAAAAEWAARLEALPLRGSTAEVNIAYRLTALAASGRIEEAFKRVPEIMARTNEDQNTHLTGIIAVGLIHRCEFDQAERFLNAIEAAAGGRNAYTNMVLNLRTMLENARSRSTNGPLKR